MWGGRLARRGQARRLPHIVPQRFLASGPLSDTVPLPEFLPEFPGRVAPPVAEFASLAQW